MLRKAFLRETGRFWEMYGDQKFTSEDAREAVENISGFFQLLAEWQAAERKAAEENREGGESCGA